MLKMMDSEPSMVTSAVHTIRKYLSQRSVVPKMVISNIVIEMRAIMDDKTPGMVDR